MNPGEIIKPPVDKDLAVQLIRDLYGLRAKNVKEFNSYDDKNYFFKSEEHENPHITGMKVKITLMKNQILYTLNPSSPLRGWVRFEGYELEGFRAGRILRRAERNNLASCFGRTGNAGMILNLALIL